MFVKSRSNRFRHRVTYAGQVSTSCRSYLLLSPQHPNKPSLTPLVSSPITVGYTDRSTSISLPCLLFYYSFAISTPGAKGRHRSHHLFPSIPPKMALITKSSPLIRTRANGPHGFPPRPSIPIRFPAQVERFSPPRSELPTRSRLRSCVFRVQRHHTARQFNHSGRTKRPMRTTT